MTEEYLASFLILNENYILKYSQEGQCDVLDYDKLVEKIKEFYNTIP